MTEIIPGSTTIGQYLIIQLIGSGSFSSVWLAQQKVTQTKVAIKMIPKRTIETSEARTRFNREISLLKQLNFPFIAEFFELIEDSTNYFLVMEYVEHGNMLDFINSVGRISEIQARRYFCQIISVLDFLHNTKFIAHRDLKAENVLLDRYYNIRVIDFGLSNVFSENQPQLKTACGSPAYAAPEMIKGQPYTKSADIWSAGILLYSMVAGELPYDDENTQRLLQKIVYTDVFYPQYMSPALVDLLKKMLQKNPAVRLTLDKIKEHTWFSQTEYAAISQLKTPEAANVEAIDKEIVDKMTNLGIDTHALTQSLLLGEFTSTTAIYKLLLKETITEKLRDLTQLGKSQAPKATEPRVLKFKFPAPGAGRPSAELGAPGAMNARRGSTPKFVPPNALQQQPGASPSAQKSPLQYQFNAPAASSAGGAALPFPGAHLRAGPGPVPVQTGQRMMQIPAPVQLANRRLSRPAAVRKTLDIPDSPAPAAKENPT